jgi:hypothetical protein
MISMYVQGHREVSILRVSLFRIYPTYLEVITLLPTVRAEYIDMILATEHESALLAAG